LGLVEKAISSHEQALVIAREIGDRRGEGNTLGSLGLTYAELGQVEKAIELLSQSLRIGTEIKDPRIIRFASAQLERLRGDGND
jgi:tetratricopeptide (TPR) repeat protein